MNKDMAMWGKCEIINKNFMEAQKAKKNLVWKFLISSPNKKIKAFTEVKENQYLTASEIKSFQKQTAGKW